LYNRMVVKQLVPAECPQFEPSELERQEDNPITDDLDPVDIDSQIASTMIQLTRLRATKLTALDKRDFLAYYDKHHHGGR
ncbi:hypothetical protein EV182_007108, partial [Spiromyces aspiralis]